METLHTIDTADWFYSHLFLSWILKNSLCASQCHSTLFDVAEKTALRTSWILIQNIGKWASQKGFYKFRLSFSLLRMARNKWNSIFKMTEVTVTAVYFYLYTYLSIFATVRIQTARSFDVTVCLCSALQIKHIEMKL